jgi:prevent-host-death family protein
MSTSITAANANREFSAMLRNVRNGTTYVVTSHGRPVARVVPFTEGAAVGQRARKTLFARLAKAAVTDVGSWTRDELYESGS